MSEEKDKNIKMLFDKVRIAEVDDRNVIIERLERVTNKKSKLAEDKWVFKGYANSIRSALKLIVNKEILIDRKQIRNLEDYLEQVKKSNDEVKRVINGMGL